MGTGQFSVPVTLTGPAGSIEHVELLVDTGATFVVIPQELADRLQLKALRSVPLRIAGGRDDVWPLAEMRITIGEIAATTPCLIAPDGPPLLGAVALESLLLAVDPVAKRLVPVKAFVG